MKKIRDKNILWGVYDSKWRIVSISKYKRTAQEEALKKSKYRWTMQTFLVDWKRLKDDGYTILKSRIHPVKNREERIEEFFKMDKFFGECKSWVTEKEDGTVGLRIQHKGGDFFFYTGEKKDGYHTMKYDGNGICLGESKNSPKDPATKFKLKDKEE